MFSHEIVKRVMKIPLMNNTPHKDKKLLLKKIVSVGQVNAISVFYSFVSNQHLCLLKAMYIYAPKNIYSSSWKNVQFQFLNVLKSESPCQQICIVDFTLFP